MNIVNAYFLIFGMRDATIFWVCPRNSQTITPAMILIVISYIPRVRSRCILTVVYWQTALMFIDDCTRQNPAQFSYCLCMPVDLIWISGSFKTLHTRSCIQIQYFLDWLAEHSSVNKTGNSKKLHIPCDLHGLDVNAQWKSSINWCSMQSTLFLPSLQSMLPWRFCMLICLQQSESLP